MGYFTTEKGLGHALIVIRWGDKQTRLSGTHFNGTLVDRKDDRYGLLHLARTSNGADTLHGVFQVNPEEDLDKPALEPGCTERDSRYHHYAAYQQIGEPFKITPNELRDLAETVYDKLLEYCGMHHKILVADCGTFARNFIHELSLCGVVPEQQRQAMKGWREKHGHIRPGSSGYSELYTRNHPASGESVDRSVRSANYSDNKMVKGGELCL